MPLMTIRQLRAELDKVGDEDAELTGDEYTLEIEVWKGNTHLGSIDAFDGWEPSHRTEAANASK